MYKKKMAMICMIAWLMGIWFSIYWYQKNVIPDVITAKPEVVYYKGQKASGEHVMYFPWVQLQQGKMTWKLQYACKYDQSYEMIAVYPGGDTQVLEKGVLPADKKKLTLKYTFDTDVSGTYYYLYFNYDGRGWLKIKQLTVSCDGQPYEKWDHTDVISAGFGAVDGQIKKLPYHYATFTFDESLQGDDSDVIRSTSFDGENVYYNVAQFDAWGRLPRIYEAGNDAAVSEINFALNGEYAVPAVIEDTSTAYVDIYKLKEDDEEIEVYAQNSNLAELFQDDYAKMIVAMLALFVVLADLWRRNRFTDAGLFALVPGYVLSGFALVACARNQLSVYMEFYMVLAVIGCFMITVVSCVVRTLDIPIDRKNAKRTIMPQLLFVSGGILFVLFRDSLFTVEQSAHRRETLILLGVACLLPSVIAVCSRSRLGKYINRIGMTSKMHIWQILLLVLGIILWIAVCILSTLEGFLIDLFAGISFEEILFHLKVPMEGTSDSMVQEYFWYAQIPLLVLLFVTLALLVFLIFYKTLRRNWIFAAGMAASAVAGAVALWIGWYNNMQLGEYFEAQRNASTFIEENYVSPSNVTLTFPKQQRNLIYIYCESMESSYISKDKGGAMEDNWIPNLTCLAQENINFSQDDLVGGFYSTYDTTWTVASLVCQTSGLPMKVPVDGNSYGDTSFLPGAVVLGDILKEQGYNQEFMCGSDGSFAGRKQYFEGHGNYQIWDYIYAAKTGAIPTGYGVWWGFEDEKLFDFAKEEVTRLSKESKPFNFTMLTADTHFVDGYFCRLCEEETDKQYENVMRCSDRQITAFVSWIKEQPFYENTTIVIAGDHLTMDNNYTQNYYDGSKPRAVYNCIINPAQNADTSITKNRLFTTMDMFPTTLSAMGVSIEGNRLGLGTDLFSGERTLAEEYGYDYIDDEVMHLSKFYNKEFVEP